MEMTPSGTAIAAAISQMATQRQSSASREPATAATMATAPIAMPPRPGTAVNGALLAIVVRMNSSDSIARSFRLTPALRSGSGTISSLPQRTFCSKVNVEIPPQRAERRQHLLIRVVGVAAARVREDEQRRVADPLGLQA